jgi:hypothetical protein
LQHSIHSLHSAPQRRTLYSAPVRHPSPSCTVHTQKLPSIQSRSTPPNRRPSANIFSPLSPPPALRQPLAFLPKPIPRCDRHRSRITATRARASRICQPWQTIVSSAGQYGCLFGLQRDGKYTRHLFRASVDVPTRKHHHNCSPPPENPRYYSIADMSGCSGSWLSSATAPAARQAC